MYNKQIHLVCVALCTAVGNETMLYKLPTCNYGDYVDVVCIVLI